MIAEEDSSFGADGGAVAYGFKKKRRGVVVRTRKASESVTARNAFLLERIEAIKSDHPFWGYRRVWAYVRYREGMTVSKNRIYRLMQAHCLMAHQTKVLRAKRTIHSKPRSKIPNTLWGTDMTKIMVDSWGWLYLHVVLD